MSAPIARGLLADAGPRPTRIGVRAMRADLVYRFALERRDLISSVEDVRALFPSWADNIFAHAVADNVAAGRFTQGSTGRLVVEEPAR